jgi:alkaline phosphatase D
MTGDFSRRRLLVGAAAWPLAACAGRAPGDAPLGPPDSATRLTRVAFGSCADQNRPQPIWEAVLNYRPELFVFAGDNVYGDSKTEELRELKLAYARAEALPGYGRLRRTVPHVAIWDDHDYGENDAGVEYAHKNASQRLFLDFWRVPAGDPRRARGGLYHAWTFGPPGQRLQLILLDTRYFRSPLKPTDQRNAPGRERYVPDFDPAKTMLGETQWRWLAERFAEPADLRLVVSSVQLVVEGHGWERWGNFPLERARFYRLVRDANANGVIVLSGDRHLGAIYRETEGVAYPLLEVTSSGISRHFANSREPGPNRLGEVYGEANFGTIDIDWAARSVGLALRDLNANAVRRFDVELDALRLRSFA